MEVDWSTSLPGGFFSRDVASLSIEAGWIPESIRVLGQEEHLLCLQLIEQLYYVRCMPFGSHPGYRRLGLAFVSFFSFSSDQFLGSTPK